MSSTDVLLIDDPAPGVRRLTMNRPEKRNALSNALRGAILSALQAADTDPRVSVSILRGAGPAFSAGYDLGANNAVDQPYFSSGGAGQWARPGGNTCAIHRCRGASQAGSHGASRIRASPPSSGSAARSRGRACSTRP